MIEENQATNKEYLTQVEEAAVMRLSGSKHGKSAVVAAGTTKAQVVPLLLQNLRSWMMMMTPSLLIPRQMMRNQSPRAIKFGGRSGPSWLLFSLLGIQFLSFGWISCFWLSHCSLV